MRRHRQKTDFIIIAMKEGDIYTQEYTVTEKIYRSFIDIFNDRNPLHTDRAFAESKSFKSEVMHGAILAGFLSHFIGECLPEKNVIVQTYKLNFIKPVYLDDKLTLNASIKGYYESVQAIEFSYTFSNEEKITVAKGNIAISMI